MATFKTKSGEQKRQAFPITEPTRISIPGGSVLALPGDWLILRPRGIYKKCEKAEFFQQFVPADALAWTFWNAIYREEEAYVGVQPPA